VESLSKSDRIKNTQLIVPSLQVLVIQRVTKAYVDIDKKTVLASGPVTIIIEFKIKE